MHTVFCNLRVDSILGDIALNTEVVCCRQKHVGSVVLDMTPDLLHPIRQHPRPTHHFANSTHRLGITANHTDSTHVMKAALGGNGFSTDSTLCKMNVFGQVFIQVMTDHQHVNMFVQRVLGKR